MKRQLVITKQESNIITTLLENEHVVEMHCAKANQEHEYLLGNIYIGKVKNILANINAAFIEIAPGVECYYPLEKSVTPIFTKKVGKKPLCIGDELVVQIHREALKTKAISLTEKISFTGKYVVLTYGDTRVGVSSKISKQQKETLQKLAKPYATLEYGFIIRTNAKDVDEQDILAEIEKLINEFEELKAKAGTRVCYSCLKKSPASYLVELKNLYQDGLEEIVVEDKGLYKEIYDYLSEHQKNDLEKLRLYEDKLLPLHKVYAIEKHLEDALKERVWLKSGAYLVIQPTEALTVIDVNTGKCISKKRDDETYYKLNLEAALEAARQIRLRNLSGIILIDFINMNSKELTERLLGKLSDELKKDPIETVLVDVTKLELVEITRKKIRKTLKETV